MPRGDGTGPVGMGPMTGRAAGFCAGYPVPGYMNPIAGRGFGFGRGLGLGFRGGRRWGGYGMAPYAAPAYSVYGASVPSYGTPYAPSPEQEADALKGQAECLKEALEGVKKRIAEIEAKITRKK